MKHLVTTSLLVAAAFASASASAVDVNAGKAKYEATCAACHGAAGISIAPIYPNLAGQKVQYLDEQLKAFRDGGRKNAIMEPMAKGLTDEDVLNISQYLSELKGS